MFKKYENQIYQIINILKDAKLRERRLEIYNNEPDNLNPLEMYVIEEILRLGNKNYFNELINSQNVDNDYIEEYNNFMNKCKTNFDYLLLKVNDYFHKNNDLTQVEKLYIYLVLKNKNKKEIIEKRSKYQYDDLYELNYSTDEDIKYAILNTAVSAGVNAMMRRNSASIEGIKQRQLSKGVFSNIDKQYLIDLINSNPESFKSIQRLSMVFYPIAKKFIDNNNGDEVLSYLFGFDVEACRTNITAQDVFGKKKRKKK